MEQTFVDFIKKQYDSHLAWLGRNSHQATGIESRLVLLKRWEQTLLGLGPLDGNMIVQLTNNDNHIICQFVQSVLITYENHGQPSSKDSPFDFSHPIVRQLIQKQHCTQYHPLYTVVKQYVFHKFIYDDNTKLDDLVQFLYQQKFSDRDICIMVFENFNTPLFSRSLNRDQIQTKLSKFGEFVMSKAKLQKNFLGSVKSNDFKEFVDDLILKQNYNNSEQKNEWLRFLLQYLPDAVTPASAIDFLTTKDHQGQRVINGESLFILIETDARKFEPTLVRAINEFPFKQENRYSLYVELNDKLGGKFHQNIIDIGESYLQSAFNKATAAQRYRYDLRTRKGYLSVEYAKYLLQQNPNAGRTRIEHYLRDADFVFAHFYKFLSEQYGQESLQYVVDGLFKESEQSDYHTTLFSILESIDIKEQINRIVDFMVDVATQKTRKQAASLFKKYTDEGLEFAKNLIGGKTVNQRITGALLLSEIDNETSIKLLNNAVDAETNDDTRDIMLEALSEKRFATPLTHQQVNEMVTAAESRKKLSSWNEKWIDEEKLPKPFWQDNHLPLSTKEIRFLIYRMKRAKGINSDIEAKQVIALIDKEKSGAFAKALLNAFQDSNADTKLKYYLTLAGLLGDDDMMRYLNTLFKKNMADKRMKMAEYVIGALAMVGTNKALRHVEVIYRKFATKKPAISQAAKEALEAAATELSISLDELADRIIPNFDFEGLYRRFEVDGDEYRAFINADFAINYLNEDNKLRKSLPANTPKELKDEFKEIEKEIKDIVRSQSNRLEKYMIDERRWPQAHWHEFFFMNPIMFVYALKLIWGIFDKDNQLIGSFYCAEDTTLYDIDDQETVITDDAYVGILHPSHLSPADCTRWHEKIYEMNMATIFPVFERTSFAVPQEESTNSQTKMFHNKKVPKGADFVNTFLVKKNWIKSPSDGGSCEFTKRYRDGEITAYANIEGPAVYYQGGDTPATVYDISFFRKTWSNKVLLKELPTVFFSEVMCDIDQLIKAE